MMKKLVKIGMRTLVALMLVTLVADTVAAQTTDTSADNEQTVEAWGKLGAGLAVGLAAIGAGFSQGNIGAAAVGMLAEDPSRFGHAIILGLLPLFM
jgi:V/A-type H+-transporting ATPase subunit K